MGLRNFGLALVVSWLTFAVSGDSKTTAWAQEGNRPREGGIPDLVAPLPAKTTTPTPDQVDAAAQSGQNLRLPPASNNRRPAPTSPVSNTRNTSRNSNQNNSAFSPRLARAAPIMGDSFSPSLVIQDEFRLDGSGFPAGGGASRSKIAENSSSLPMDRLIFNYNHFHNAIDDTLTHSSNVDRFALGFEKTFRDEMMSIEVRMPFLADNDFGPVGMTSRNGSDVGNLSVTLKSVLTSDSDSLCAAGLTIDTPTSGDTILTGPLPLVFSNDAVHLSPFLGFLCTPRGGNIHQGFLQIDVPTNANGLTDGINPPTELLEQTLLYVDYSFGKQLYNAGRSAQGSCDIRRVLGLAELHYTTTLEDSDVALLGMNNQVTSRGNRLDVVNLTFGLHTEFTNGTQLRLATVAPITDGDDRFFDFEFQAQLNVLLR